MTWQIISLAVIRITLAILIYFIARNATQYRDTDDQLYWMFFIGYIVGRVLSMLEI